MDCLPETISYRKSLINPSILTNVPTFRQAILDINDRGHSLVKQLLAFPQVEVAYLCASDSAVVPPVAQSVVKQRGKSPKVVKDFRVALDDPNIDALVCPPSNQIFKAFLIIGAKQSRCVFSTCFARQ